jgi:hypothetical protein
MQITNTNGTHSVADRIPDMVETKDPVSESKRYNGGSHEILITYTIITAKEYNFQARVVWLQCRSVIALYYL